MNRYLTLGLLLICLNCVLAQYPRRKPQEKIPEMDKTCLGCICQASSNCDTTLKCHNSGSSYFCGPYVISWPYWHDGGRQGDKGKPHDFETCLTDKSCAEETVRNYMRKYGQDCDGNGIIDCYDFAIIHKMGYGSCSSAAIYETEYYEKFNVCYGPYLDGNSDGYDGNYDANRNDNQKDPVDYGDAEIDARRNGQQG